MNDKLDSLKSAIIKVRDARGFVIKHDHERLVITSGHCLPFIPPCHRSRYVEEAMYHDLLGKIGDAPSVSVLCIFINPIDDIAVLSSPDEQSYFEEAEEYWELMDNLPVIQIGVIEINQPVWLLDLDQEWRQSTVKFLTDKDVAIENKSELIKRGMSGSPILNGYGHAVGVVSVVTNIGVSSNPYLRGSLPAWLLN